MHEQHHGGKSEQSPGVSTVCVLGVGWIHGQAVPSWHRASEFNVACFLVRCVWVALADRSF